MSRNRSATKLARSLAREEPDPVARMRRIMASRDEAPYAICRTGEPGSRSRTLAGVIMDLTCDRLYLAAGCTRDSPWARRPGVG